MSYQDSSRALSVAVADKSVGCEVTCEYTLPDYEAEIRRLLRVNVSVMPPASYVGGGNAAFSGFLRFDLLYESPEGKLCMAKVTEDYEVSTTVDFPSGVDPSDGTAAFCDLLPESLVSRVLSQRKVSIRCRLGGRAKVYGRLTPTERMTGEFSPEGIERLTGTASSAVFATASSEELELGEEITPSGLGEFSVIGSEGTVHLSEVGCVDGAVLCRGEALVQLLLDGEEGVCSLPVRIPFSERVEGDGIFSGMTCRAYGALPELRAEKEEDHVRLTLSLRLVAEAQTNAEIPYTRDLYSTARHTKVTTGKITHPHAAVCRSGSFTQSLYEPLSRFPIPPEAKILALSAAAHTENLLCDRGKWALVGDCRMNLLLLAEGEYKCVEIPIPFRYEFDGPCGESEGLFSELHMIGGRARIDGDKLALDCEMGVSLRFCLRHEIELLQEAFFGEKTEQSDDYVVCFPRRGETLFEIGKRYHAPLGRLRAINRLDEKDTMGQYLVING